MRGLYGSLISSFDTTNASWLVLGGTILGRVCLLFSSDNYFIVNTIILLIILNRKYLVAFTSFINVL